MDLQGLALRMRDEFLIDGAGVTDKENFWPLPNLYSALISAEKELVRRLHLIYDASTPSICQIAIAAVNGVFPRSYPLNDRIIKIKRLMYPGQSRPLPQKSLEQLDQEFQPSGLYSDDYRNSGGSMSSWDTQTGVPTAFTLDYISGYLTFNRQPLVAGIAHMAVKRLPLTDRVAIDARATATLEVKQYDEEIIHGALKYAYLKDDSQTFDPVRSALWAKTFEADIQRIQQDRATLNPQPYVMRPERF